mmetsp:Transcript_107040/g.301183  ORF Transcript_107040/g.301183 Transcript_107040/m.301183 type:complete len:188 (-) Transcript_107040:7-570(-)
MHCKGPSQWFLERPHVAAASRCAAERSPHQTWAVSYIPPSQRTPLKMVPFFATLTAVVVVVVLVDVVVLVVVVVAVDVDVVVVVVDQVDDVQVDVKAETDAVEAVALSALYKSALPCVVADLLAMRSVVGAGVAATIACFAGSAQATRNPVPNMQAQPRYDRALGRVVMDHINLDTSDVDSKTSSLS